MCNMERACEAMIHWVFTQRMLQIYCDEPYGSIGANDLHFSAFFSQTTFPSTGDLFGLSLPTIPPA